MLPRWPAQAWHAQSRHAQTRHAQARHAKRHLPAPRCSVRNIAALHELAVVALDLDVDRVAQVSAALGLQPCDVLLTSGPSDAGQQEHNVARLAARGCIACAPVPPRNNSKSHLHARHAAEAHDPRQPRQYKHGVRKYGSELKRREGWRGGCGQCGGRRRRRQRRRRRWEVPAAAAICR